jgi:4-amino-4-deoxy-L-arabinose transferase-like glycosyltransferase
VARRAHRRRGPIRLLREAGGRPLLFILALALAVRLLALAATPNYEPFGDPADYDRHAAALQYLGTYPPTQLAEPGTATAFRPPAYPYLLATSYVLTGQRWNAGRALGALLGVATVLLVFVIAYSQWGRRIALWSAGVAAVFPPLVLLSTGLVAENLFVPVVLAALACVLAARRPGARWWWAAAAGALCGLAALTRGNGIALLVPVGFGLVRGWPGRHPRALVAPGVAIAAALLVLAPWTIRNFAAFDRFLPMGTAGGITLAGTYNPASDSPGKFEAAARNPGDVPDYRPLLRQDDVDEAALASNLGQKGYRYARDHLGYVATALRLNALRTFDLGRGHTWRSELHWREMGIPRRLHGTLRLSFYLALLLAAFGVIFLRRGDYSGPGFLWWAPGVLLVASVWVVGGPRYRAPLDPFLAILVAMALVHWRDRRVARA